MDMVGCFHFLLMRPELHIAEAVALFSKWLAQLETDTILAVCTAGAAMISAIVACLLHRLNKEMFQAAHRSRLRIRQLHHPPLKEIEEAAKTDPQQEIKMGFKVVNVGDRPAAILEAHLTFKNEAQKNEALPEKWQAGERRELAPGEFTDVWVKPLLKWSDYPKMYLAKVPGYSAWVIGGIRYKGSFGRVRETCASWEHDPLSHSFVKTKSNYDYED